MMNDRFCIRWWDGGREPQCPPNPDYPEGIDIKLKPASVPLNRCVAKLPYPALRRGAYIVECARCGATVAVTTAGRPDDPRSVEMECRG
jgi:hypothetical protein